jgi:hypothetical protein
MYEKSKRPSVLCSRSFIMSQFDRTIKIKRTNGKENKSIPIICIGCNEIFKISQWHVEENKRIGPSHGMCLKCYEKDIEKIKKK